MGNRAHLITSRRHQESDTINIDRDWQIAEDLFDVVLRTSDGRIAALEGTCDDIEAKLPLTDLDADTIKRIKRDIARCRKKGE